MSAEVTGSFALIEREGNLLLIANHRVLGGRSVLCWDVPGGGVEQGESLVDALKREVVEETGLVIEPVDLEFVVERFGFESPNPSERSRYFFFSAREVGGVLAPTDPEIVDLGFFPPEEVKRLCTESYHAEFLAWYGSRSRKRYFKSTLRR